MQITTSAVLGEKFTHRNMWNGISSSLHLFNFKTGKQVDIILCPK